MAAPEIFFCGGIEAAKCDSEGQKSKKIAKNGWFWPFFLEGGKWRGGRASNWGVKCPMPPLMPPLALIGAWAAIGMNTVHVHMVAKAWWHVYRHLLHTNTVFSPFWCEKTTNDQKVGMSSPPLFINTLIFSTMFTPGYCIWLRRFHTAWVNLVEF